MSGENIDETVDDINSEQFSVAKGLLGDFLINMIDIPFFSEAFAPLYGGQLPVRPFTYTHDAAFNRQDKLLESLGKKVYEDSRMVELVEDNLSVLRSAEHSSTAMHRNIAKYLGVQEFLIRNLAGFISITDEVVQVPYEEFDLIDKVAFKLGILQVPNKRVTTTELNDNWMLDRRVIDCLNRMYGFTCGIEEHGDAALAQYEKYNMDVKESIPEFAEAWKVRMEGLNMSTLAGYYPAYFNIPEGATGLHSKKNGINRVIEEFLNGRGSLKDPYSSEGVPMMDLSSAKRFMGRMIELRYTFEGHFHVKDDARCIFSKDYDAPEQSTVDNVVEFPDMRLVQNE